jgi:hypothetical protein
MKLPFPLKTMLAEKNKEFAELFRKVMNLHLGMNIVGKPVSDKDREGRVQQAIKDSLPEE